MSESRILERERAEQLIAAVDEPVKRNAVRSVVDGVMRFYNEDPSRLVGSFDLAFFVDVLIYDIREGSKLLREIVPRGYWANPGELPPAEVWPEVDPANDVGPQGLRYRQAHNYCVLHTDKWLGEVCFRLTNFATLKQELMNPRRHHYTVPEQEPAKPAAPVAPFDHLFMVMAVDHALRPGQPARRLMDEEPIP